MTHLEAWAIVLAVIFGAWLALRALGNALRWWATITRERGDLE